MEKRYTNGKITIVWRPALCIHVGVCWRTLPQVYRPQERPWVRPEMAATAELIAQIDRCPSRALTYERNK
jgi:uncharacterized Fe-S cluster protein YjdI